MNIVNRITLKGLKKNKMRTIVTIIGVILSASMITAVTTLVSSVQNYMINCTIEETGDWHALLFDKSYEDFLQISEMEEIEDVVASKDVGYAMLEGGINEYKPYLHLIEANEKSLDVLPVRLKSGRLPQNEKEVVVSNHTFTNGGVKYELGDSLSLDIGQRVDTEGNTLNQRDELRIEEESIVEKLVKAETRKFTVVGICQRFPDELEGFSAPGYTVITRMKEDIIAKEEPINIYLKAKNPKEIYDIVETIHNVENYGRFKYNDTLLSVMGASDNGNFMKVLVSLGAILIVLIMGGSISLIYNSFSISVSERKKQFGLLSGTGATVKQIKHSIFFEAMVIALVGIPFGVIAGIAGIGVTFYFLRDIFSSIFVKETSVLLTVYVSIPVIVIAILVCLLTILLSAYIPARRSGKISAMDAIRQTADIKVTAKQVKVNPIIGKIFGIEGMLALKNLKRNRRRYRSTVISLFISVVLFISASAFSMYLKDSVVDVYENHNYDIAYKLVGANEDEDKEDEMEIYHDIMALDNVKKGATTKSLFSDIEFSKAQINESIYEESVMLEAIKEGEDLNVTIELCSLDHNTFIDYVKELGLNLEVYQDAKAPTGIVIDKQHYYDGKEKRFINTNLLKDDKIDTLSIDPNSEEEVDSADIVIGAFTDKIPMGVNDPYYNSIILVIDEDLRKTAFPDFGGYWGPIQMFFTIDDLVQGENDIKDLLLGKGLSTSGVYNAAEELQGNRNMIMVLSVFSYGFIVLISLITIANVFNTISTNLSLRRREFAMLKSVGMTSHSFNKMLNFECVFYGLKALIYGLPVSILFTYLIYLSVVQGVDMNFYLPIKSILVSIFSVFFVVFVTMMYSMSKIKKENILEALKNENL
jgi:putative ABC transport system permease protein